MRITQNEVTAGERRVGFRCVSDVDGVTPLTGLTFAASELRIGKNFTESNYAGTATEVADGYYYYEFTTGEVDTLGALTIRLNKATVRSFLVQHQVIP